MKKLFFWFMITGLLITGNSLHADTFVTVQDGDWNSTDTWVGGVVPTTADSVVVQHQVNIINGDSCKHLYVAPSGTIQNKINATRRLAVMGNLWLDGTATYTNNNLHIKLGGNLHLNGVWDSPEIHFTGSSEQTVSAAPGKVFEATINSVDFLDEDPLSPVKFFTSLTFINIRLLMYDGTLEFAPGIEVAFLEEPIYDADIIGNGSSLRMGDGSFIETCNLDNLTFKGTVNISTGNTATGEIINADTLQNRINGTRTLEVFGNFTNLGVIRNTNNYMNFIIHGNLTNSGEWADGSLFFDGTTDHTINFAPGKFIDCDEFENLNPAAKLILLSDIEIHGGFVMPNEGVIEANNHLIILRENAHVQACTITDAQLGGEFKVQSGVVFSGTTIVVDSLTIRNAYSHQLITVDGVLVNNGFISRNSYSTTYGLQIDLTGNLQNNGLFDAERLRFTGTQEQYVSSQQKGTELAVEILQDSDPAQGIRFDTDVTLVACDILLDESTLHLNNVNLVMVGGKIQDGYLTSQQNYLHQSQNAYIFNMHISETHLGGDCHIYYNTGNHFENVTVDDTLRNRDVSGYVALNTSGDFINNGVITTHNSYRIELHVEGNFYNHGNAHLKEVNFTGTGIQEFSCATGIIYDADIINAKTDGYVLVVDDLNFSNCILSFSDKEMHLQNATIYAEGGYIRFVKIIGNGNKLDISNNGFIQDVYLQDVILQNNVGMRGTNNTFENVTVTDTLSRGGNYFNDIEITVKGRLQNNGYIDSDHNSYDFDFYVEDTIINNGVFMAEKIQFSGSGTHYIQSQGGNVFELEQLFNPANGGLVEVISDLLVKNAEMDFNGHELNLPANGLLQLDNTEMDDVVINAVENAVITGLNESVIKYSTIDGALLFGNFEIHEDNIFKDCILDAALVNDNIYSDVELNLEGMIENNNTIQNRESWSYEMYLNVFGHLMHDGVIECEEARWQGTEDQDIYLLNGNEINTPCEFDAMSMSSPFQWYKNDVLIDGADDRWYNLPMIGTADRGYYHCETGEGPSRTIRICTPVEIDLAAEAWFCQDETVTLEPEITFGEPPYTWSWSPAAGLSNPNIQNPEANPSEPTMYTLIVTDVIGCTGQINIMVQQYPQVFASAGNDAEICFGQSIQLDGSAWGGQPGYMYEWTPAAGLNDPNIANPVASPDYTTIYTLTVTDGNGCQENAAVTVTVNPLPDEYGLACDSAHFCYTQDTIICWLLGSQVGVEYHLMVNGNPNPGGEVYQGTGAAIPLWAVTTLEGFYWLKAMDITTGCEKVMPDTMVIFIDMPPEIVDQSGDEILIEGESKKLWVEVTSTQPPSFQWYKNGEIIDGATGDGLWLNEVTQDDTGEYFCVITNNCDIIQSEPVNITVLTRQTVELPAGWSGFSTYQEVYNANPDQMFAQLAGNLVIVNDFEHVYWPAGGINTYPAWDAATGAQIKLSQNATLHVDGLPADLTTVALDAGWHYLSVLSQCSVTATDIFDQMGTKLIIAKDIAGTQVYWPGQQIFTLHQLEPGKAYFVKLENPVSFTWPECNKSTVPIVTSVKYAFNPWITVPPTPVSHLIAIPEAIGGLHFVEGDVIGVFNGEGICCGSAVYSGESIVITAFADDETTGENDGFAEGEEMALRWYRNTTVGDVELEARYAEGSGAFTGHGFSVVSGLETVTAVTEPDAGGQLTVYPNPAHDRIFIKGLNGPASFEIISQCGRIMAKGNYLQHHGIDIKNLNAGLYTIRIIEKGRASARKLLIN